MVCCSSEMATPTLVAQRATLVQRTPPPSAMLADRSAYAQPLERLLHPPVRSHAPRSPPPLLMIERRSPPLLPRSLAPRSPPPLLMSGADTSGAWRGQLAPADECVSSRPCRVTQGRIPEELVGTLFRIGSGDSSPYDHWFDGDGWVCAVAFRGPDKPPLFKARWVDTDRRKAQQEWSGSGRATRGAWTQRSDGSVAENIARLPTNPANTNLLLRDGRLLALCEGGPPVVLDPATLSTLAPSDAYGVASFFAAHPKEDPATGSLVGCGLKLGAMSVDNLLPSFPSPLNFFEWPKGAKKPTRQRAHELPFFTFVHDMGLTPTRAVVVLPPYVIPDLQTYVSAVLGQRAVGMCFEWKPELGTRVMVIDRASLELEALVTLPQPAPTCYHIINAFEEAEGEAAGASLLHIQICEQANGDRAMLERQYMDIANAAFTAELQCKAVEYVIRLPGGANDADSGASFVARRELASAAARPFELPDIHPSYVGRRARYAYCWCLQSDASTFADALQRIELTEGGGASEVVSFGPGRLAGSPLFVPRGEAEDDGYILVFVYDAARHVSDLVVLDAKDLAGEPVATVALGQHVPPLFHGIWTEDVCLTDE